MDFFLYGILFAVLGLIKMRTPSDKVVNTILSNPGEAIIESAILPIGTNYSLIKETLLTLD